MGDRVLGLGKGSMTRMRSRIAGLKMQLVVSVTAATGACGGTVTGSSSVADGIGGGTSGAAGAPSTGGSESTGGASNGGGPAGAGGSSNGGNPSWTGGVSSRGGQQQGGAGGNIDPPPPPVCPASAPGNGASCSDEGLACTYQQFGGCPEWDTSATCARGIWSVSVRICG